MLAFGSPFRRLAAAPSNSDNVPVVALALWALLLLHGGCEGVVLACMCVYHASSHQTGRAMRNDMQVHGLQQRRPTHQAMEAAATAMVGGRLPTPACWPPLPVLSL